MIEVLSLFPFFPRRVGIPSKMKDIVSVEIGSEKEFLSYYNFYRFQPNGCHVSVYDTTEMPVIDKVLFEFDGKDLDKVFEEVKHFLSLIDNKFEYIVMFSGRKGFHVYILLRPEEYQVETAKVMLRDFVSDYFKDFRFLDLTKTGVLGCLIRVPNSRNGNGFCVPLPKDFVDWNTMQIIEWSKEPRKLSVQISRELPTLADITDVKHVKPSSISSYKRDDNFLEINYLPFELTKPLLRPCTFYEIQKEDPPHIVRFNFVAELLDCGLSPNSIHRLIKQLNWKTKIEQATIFLISMNADSCHLVAREHNTLLIVQGIVVSEVMCVERTEFETIAIPFCKDGKIRWQGSPTGKF
jgi:hypothetical protein